MSDFQPLKIIFEVVNLALPTMPIHLDDLLAAAAVIKHKENNRSAEVIDYDAIIDNLPIEKQYVETEWVYKASALTYESIHGKFMRPYSQRINQTSYAIRQDDGTLKSGISAINYGSGPLKASIGLTPTAARVLCVGHCLAQKEAVNDLLGHLTNMGKRHNRGQGEILSVTVTEDTNDQLWRRRHLPIVMSDLKVDDHGLVSQIGTRPPYWKNTQGIAYGIGNYFTA
jgi:CRISPR type IV-associated protein Csf3